MFCAIILFVVITIAVSAPISSGEDKTIFNDGYNEISESETNALLNGFNENININTNLKHLSKMNPNVRTSLKFNDSANEMLDVETHLEDAAEDANSIDIDDRDKPESTMNEKTGLYLFGYAFFIMTLVAMPFTSCLEQIKKNTFNTNGLGTYSFEYETTGGTYRREDGGIISPPEGGALVVRGEYGYIDPGGKLFSLKYVADSNGYHPLFDENDVRFNDRRII